MLKISKEIIQLKTKIQILMQILSLLNHYNHNSHKLKEMGRKDMESNLQYSQALLIRIELLWKYQILERLMKSR